MDKLTKPMQTALGMFRDSLRKDRACHPSSIVEEYQIKPCGLSKSTFKALEKRGLIRRIQVDPAMPGYQITDAGRALLPPKTQQRDA